MMRGLSNAVGAKSRLALGFTIKVPMRICIWAKPARDASSRFDEDDQLDESKPIPETKDGLLYCCWPVHCGERLTIDEAKAAANAEPWGPVKWD
jgi:hypothetical protein